MSESSLQKKGYMSSKDAGALLGYTHDYISRLCRQGKMSGIQKGREWFVTQEEIDAFKLRHEVELKEKKIELSKKFSKIRLEHEAKKRSAREQQKSSSPQLASLIEKSPVLRTFKTDKKSVKFVLPRELVAMAVLALMVLIPSMLNTVSSSFSQKGAETTYAQSARVGSTANTSAVAPDLGNGFQQFFSTISELPRETYRTWLTISNGYLTLYVVQGELVYNSVQNLNTVGASVLQGYEILGESFVVGFGDIIKIYSEILNPDSQVESAKKKLSNYTQSVEDGFQYAATSASVTFLQTFTLQIKSGYDLFITNVGMNIFAIQTTTSNISESLLSNLVSLTDFSFESKEEIRSIKLNQ